MNASPDMIVPDQHLVDRIVDLSRHAGAEICPSSEQLGRMGAAANGGLGAPGLAV
jgi:hypothetical protein